MGASGDLKDLAVNVKARAFANEKALTFEARSFGVPQDDKLPRISAKQCWIWSS